MSLVPYEYVAAPALVRKFAPLIEAEFPGALINSDGHDLFVETDGSEIVPVETAYRIVRAMRNGADHDASRPVDWHVRGLQPIHNITDKPDAVDKPPHVIGTAIWFSQSYTLPSDYDESNHDVRTLVAPGALAPLQ